MAFRDFNAFNLALLAKQGLRFLQNPNSLVYRVCKARYFPKSHFFKVKLGTNPYFIWRNILAARQVVLENRVWQVNKILGRQMALFHPRKKPNGDELVFMNDLLDANRNWWDETKVDLVFDDKSTRKIKQITLGNLNSNDQRV